MRGFDAIACVRNMETGGFVFRKTAKIEPIKLKLGWFVLQTLGFFSKNNLKNLITRLMRNSPTKATPAQTWA